MTYRLADWQAGTPLPKGFDVADAEAFGWSVEDVTAFMRATVRPWSPDGAPTPPADPTPPPPAPPVDPVPPAAPPAAPIVRPYAELMEAVQNLAEGDVDQIEAILFEASQMSTVRQDAILRALKSATGLGLVALKKQMKETDGSDSGGADHLELARRAVSYIGADKIICVTPFVWMWSDTGVWKQQEDRMIKQRVQRTIEMEGLPVTSALVNGVSEVLKNEIFSDGHVFNKGHPETINAINGQIVPDGDGWRIEPHQMEHYRTTQVPIVFDPAATAPRWDRFLDEVFLNDPDRAEKRAALLEMMGYSLMSHARHELFCLMIGTGGNGKSVVLAVLEAMCGKDNVAGVQPSSFDRAFQRAHLDQKLVNIVTEIKQGEVIADAELKGIVSGEKSTVEHKFQDPFDMHPFATCWFGTNHMPHTRDFSDALFQRALILKFNRNFRVEGVRDPLLKETLISDELPGIMNMALAAYRRACRVGFTKPASSEEAKHEWRLEADQVAAFVDDACTREAGSAVNSSVLFTEYQDWSRQQGISKTMSLKGLRDRLTRLGFGAERRRDGRYVTGIKIGATVDDKIEGDGW